MRKAMAAALVAATVFAGCGGDDEDTTTGAQDTTTQSETTTATQSTEQAAPPEPAGIPTYEEAVEIALENESVKKACARSREDKDIGAYGDAVYKRLLCGGVPRMDYVVGSEPVEENFDAARGGRSPLWTLEGEAYIEGPDLDNEFAQKIKDQCSCGEVVEGKLK